MKILFVGPSFQNAMIEPIGRLNLREMRAVVESANKANDPIYAARIKREFELLK